MTRSKTNKLIAIIMAVFMAFAFMSFSLTYVSAEENPIVEGPDYNLYIGMPLVNRNEGKDYWYVANQASYEKYPVFIIDVKFDNNDATFADSKLYDHVKVYTDAALEQALSLPFDWFTNTVITSSEIKFNLSLTKMSSMLKDGNTYYLKLDKELTKTSTNEGNDIVIEFAVPGTSTTNSTSSTTRTTTRSTTSTRTTTRTTYRTITTRNSTVRARSANTDDPRHLPVWIGLAAVAALMLGAVYFSKERN